MSKPASKQAAKKRIEKLRQIINDYRYHYHVLDESLMSEAAADSLKHELTELEAQYPELITPDSPSQRVAGAPLAAFRSVAHSQRMLSLNDVFNSDETQAWLERISKLAPIKELFADVKMDGLACALVYQDGLLTQAITRGDGFTGEDVTMNVRTIESVPLRLHGSGIFTKGRTEIRGEIVMYKDDFAALNVKREADGQPLFANPRNLAAGTIRQLDPKLVAARKLHFHGYDLIRDDPADIVSHSYAYESMATLGFIVNRRYELVKPTAAAIKQVVDRWESRRQSLPFNTDGLVIKVNDRSAYAALGVVGKAPRGAIAYKYPAEQATTKVLDIIVSIGRTGAATPVAVLDPVVVAGSRVQMATLHNEGEIARKDIRVGDTVIIHKAGDIIPEVIRPLAELRDGSEQQFLMPKKCPDCGTPLHKQTADEAVWRCPNDACPSRVQNQIRHFASKGALDIEGLGEKNVQALLQAGLIREIPDIYALTTDQLLQLERFAAVSANNLVEAIEQKKSPSLPRFVFGLGIRHVGTQTALDLARHFHSLDALSNATVEELKVVEGVGSVVAESIVTWFEAPSNRAIMHRFRELGVWPQDLVQSGGKLEGVQMVVTGTLESMGREAAAELIRQHGGTFQTSVAKDTTYLVAGANTGASKLAKAQKYGTEVIDEAAFLKLVQD